MENWRLSRAAGASSYIGAAVEEIEICLYYNGIDAVCCRAGKLSTFNSRLSTSKYLDESHDG